MSNGEPQKDLKYRNKKEYVPGSCGVDQLKREQDGKVR